MEITLTPEQAFDHFLKNWEGAVPKDVQEAKYARDGLRRAGLGRTRIKNLLEKYAPGKYEWREVVVVRESKT